MGGRARPKVGFVGVGSMGRPMVERLLAASLPVRFHARRAAVVDQVAGLGAEPAGDPAAAGRGRDVVVVCVFTDRQVLEVALGDAGVLAAMPPGSTLVVHTTASPLTVEEVAEAGAERGVGVVDAAVSGTPADIAAGHLTLLVGGDDRHVDACRPVLAAYGDPIFHLGPLGAGMRVKLVNNALLAAHVALAVEAGRIAEALGIPAATAAAAITHGSGTSRALDMAVAAGSPAALRAGILPFIGKDVAVAEEVASTLGVDLGLLGRVARAAVDGT